jgi:hypothetical protein
MPQRGKKESLATRRKQQTPESTDADFLSTIIADNLHVNFKNVEVLLLLISEIQRDPELRQQYLDQVIQPALSYWKNI